MSILQPWEKQPDEPGLWWERFDRYYRPLGAGRKLSEAYYNYYKDTHGERPERAGYTSSWHNAFKEWNWQERAEAYDRHVHEEIIKQEKKERVKMSQRHVEDAQAIQTLAMNTILDEGITDVPTALRAFRQAVQIERQARGIPDHLTQIQDMTDDELEEALARELARAHLQGIQTEDEGSVSLTEGKASSESEESDPGGSDGSANGGEVSSSETISEESS